MLKTKNKLGKLKKEDLINPAAGESGFKSFFPNKVFYRKTRGIFYASILTALITTFNVFVDNFVVGRLGGDAVSGLGMATFSLGILNLFVNGISMCFAGLMAQSLNSKRIHDAQMAWDLTLLMTTILGILGMLLFYNLGESILRLQIKNNETAINYGEIYLKFGTAAFLFNAFSFHHDKLFGAIGKQKMILIVAIFTVILNVSLSIGLTYGLGFGIEGIAIGTFISVLVGLFIKMFFAHYDKDLNIKVLIYRLFFVKFIAFKLIRKTWYYLPFEAIWWVLNYGATILLTRNFDNADFVYSVGNPFWYTFISATGSVPILNRYIGGALGFGKEKLAKKYNQIIAVMSMIRMIPIAIALIVFAFLVPYLHIYSVSSEELWPGQVFLIYCGFSSIFGIMYTIGYVSLALGGRPLKAMFLDIICKSIILISMAIAVSFSTNIFIGLLFFVLSSWLTDFIMIFGSFGIKNFRSLYRKNQSSLLDKVEKEAVEKERLHKKNQS